MSVQNTTLSRRFYDQEPIVSHAIDAILDFPSQVQGIVAKGLSLLAIKDFNANDKMTQMKSLGKDIILPLYKSKQKKRFYDDNSDMHNALNYLRVLSAEERIITSTKVLDIAEYINQYLNVCDSSSTDPAEQKAQNIRDIYVLRGAPDSKKYLDSICLEILKSLPAPAPTPVPIPSVSPSGETIRLEVSMDDKIVRFDKT